MTKKDVLELKRRLKKDDCTFTKMCGCYVNADKEIILNIQETFLNLEEIEFFKYLEIAKKTMSGTIGNNLIELEFPLEEEKIGGKQQFLMGLKESGLKNEALLNTFYQLVIDTYDYTGNYLILIFHDAYDVMTKTSDNAKLDESEEVYEYLLCAICPVSLSKPGLGYLEVENRIGPRNRDWVVGAPDTGFIFPAFTDRSTDIHSILFYTRNTKEPHKEFMEEGLGCPAKQTATEQKNTFQSIINNAINDEEKSNLILMDIQEGLSQIIDEQAVFEDSPSEPIILTNDSIQDLLVDSGLPEEITTKIESAYVETFGEAPPVVDHLIDSKILAVSAQRKKEQALEEQVQQLQEKLDEMIEVQQEIEPSQSYHESNLSVEDSTTLQETDSSKDSVEVGESITHNLNSNIDVVLQVKPQKMNQIKSQIIDGQKCLIIPIEENEQASVNGVTTIL